MILQVSNIIFIDSPVGSGFSYGTLEEGFISSDTTAVKRLVVFLKKWLRGHPQFLSNSLYVGGESYCGMIIPTLALEIHISNKESGEEPLLNLKGYFAGNPVTDDRFDTAGKVQFFHGMGLLSDELYEFAMENCGGNYSDPPNVLCAESIQAIADCTKDINLSHILEPKCEAIWSPRIQQAAARNGTSGLTVQYSAGDDLLFPFKCRSDAQQLSYIWANDEGVRESLGVRKGTKGEWKRCDRDLPYARDITSTVEIHSRLRRQGYPALIYSGDHDSKFPFVGTQAWIRSLNLSITDDWRPWPSCWGAGHTAPEYKPKECLEMFARWLSGDPL
ncbi:serine carboxypeptidase-like 19 [Aegilops tauschii subsp. strangulata]|nr:serine carboxypeptidase-like 19 isoform X1 [Aegilops tauschii subsp. strangulata]